MTLRRSPTSFDKEQKKFIDAIFWHKRRRTFAVELKRD